FFILYKSTVFFVSTIKNLKNVTHIEIGILYFLGRIPHCARVRDMLHVARSMPPLHTLRCACVGKDMPKIKT
ncbi:MAG: hypothetical protein RML94_16645, partial [Bacteroidia bacterium]|nr:hypothetical protein [Bacteroidia bacterium]